MPPEKTDRQNLLTSAKSLIILVCLAEVLSMSGFATFAALLPQLQASWHLSNTEAGWISGVYYVGYVAAVPVLVGFTDHVDSRRIYLIGALCGALGSFGFAWLADGFWSAMLFRALAGIGLAGTYMPGLKLLTDRIVGPLQLRAVPYYTASFSLGASFSYLLASETAKWVGWTGAFALAGATSVGAFALVLLFVAAMHPTPSGTTRALFNFRPVLRDSGVMSYVLAYGGHSWELFAMRAWLVAFLYFSLGLQAQGVWTASPGVIASLVTLIGVPASIIGAEIATRVNRRQMIRLAMLLSVIMSVTLGFSSPLPFAVVVTLAFAYNVMIMTDSAALTAGVLAQTRAEIKGATMAVHSLVGFSGGVVGPLAAGVVLDFAGGGDSQFAWGLAFAAMGAGSALGLLAVSFVGRASRS
jgi:MFS family permease